MGPCFRRDDSGFFDPTPIIMMPRRNPHIDHAQIARRANLPRRLTSDFQKSSCLQPQISGFIRIVPARQEGRRASSRNAGRDAMDVMALKRRAAPARTAKSCGPDAPTLASSRRMMIRR
jgi:hypothetical protein